MSYNKENTSEKQHQSDLRYLRMATIWAENSYCRRRKVGALIVKDQMIISDGYNGTPSGFENVCEDESGMTKPYVLHAEANAIISASRNECIGGTIYLAARDVASGELLTNLQPCPMCRRMIINAGLSKIVIRRTKTTYDTINVQEWVFNDDSVIDPNEFQESAE